MEHTRTHTFFPRHIDVAQLGVQEHVLNGSFELREIKGDDNHADALTQGKRDHHISACCPSLLAVPCHKRMIDTCQIIEHRRHALMPGAVD